MAEEQKKVEAKKPVSKRLNFFQRKALEKKEMRMGKEDDCRGEEERQQNHLYFS
ncbi:MAG: hypothetical protein LKE52_00985 [Bacilli bacterium]|jgi:hypothetical protein|nr:hypothetical protein [Bacilli bacterium]